MFSNGYSYTGFLQQCVIPVAEVSICVMSTRRILCSEEMLESFSPNEKLPGKCVKMSRRKLSATSGDHSQGRVSAEHGGCSCSTVLKAHTTHAQPANHSGCHFL